MSECAVECGGWTPLWFLFKETQSGVQLHSQFLSRAILDQIRASGFSRPHFCLELGNAPGRSIMQVREVMTRGVECVRPEDTVSTAASRMRELDVGSVPVCGDDDRLVGMLTDRDITVRATAGGADPSCTYVRDVMTPNIVYCFEDQNVNEAARMMKDNQIRRLVVLTRDKRMIGILSLGDLAVDTGNEQLAGRTLERISEPTGPQRT